MKDHNLHDSICSSTDPFLTSVLNKNNTSRMAPSPLRSLAKITNKHSRSFSFPSQSHSSLPQFDELLSRIRSSSEATCSSMSSFSSRMSDLESLYDCIDDLLHLPHIQQAISEEHQDDLSDVYMRLLDICSKAKDVFSLEKQNVRDLLSAFRRRRNIDDISAYLSSKKKSKKIIHQSIKDLKAIKIKESVMASENPETMTIVSMIKEVELVTLALLKALLSYVNGKTSSRSLISKLMHSKDEKSEANEFEKVDAMLRSLNKTSKGEEVQNLLVEIESNIQDLEEGLECFYRRLIKSRVSLLNIFNH